MAADKPWQGTPRGSSFARSYEKWGIDVVQAGYVMLPKDLIDINLHLIEKHRLTPAEFMALVIIISNWNDARQIPAASKSYIAERMNISVRQAQRVISSLINKKAIRRIPGYENTGYASQFFLGGILTAVRRVRNFKVSGSYIPNTDQLSLELGDDEYIGPTLF